MAPEYMTERIDERDDGLDPEAVDRVLELARDVIAIGPGLGQAPSTQTVRQERWSIARRCRSSSMRTG